MPKKLLLISIVAIAAHGAQEADTIRSIVTALNQARVKHDSKVFAQIFAPDADLRVGSQLTATGPIAIGNALGLSSPETWSETTTPSIRIESIRFLSPDVALVDAVQSRFGSLVLKQSVPVTLMLKRSGKMWRIVSMRLLLQM